MIEPEALVFMVSKNEIMSNKNRFIVSSTQAIEPEAPDFMVQNV